MSQANAENMAHEPNFLLIQNALSTDAQTEARAFPGNLVEPLAELASTDPLASGSQSPGQGQFSKGDAMRTTHCLPTSNQEKEMLLQELAASYQMLQHQQTLTESLTEQLVSSQEQIAQMERDLALLQQSYDEQQHLLKHAEANCQNLKARLHRQQHQSLQFKAALEKCLETATLQNKPDLNQGYHTTATSQPSRHPSGCGPSQKIGSDTIESLAAINPFPLGHASQGIDTSTSSNNVTHQPVVQHIHATPRAKHEVFPEETAHLQEITYPENRPSRPPLIFRGHPVQPWSASQALPTSSSTHQEQSTIYGASSTTQAVGVEAAKPSQRNPTASTHLTQSSPLLEPLQPRRKSPVRIELPTFPRR
jgi:hypothetical protein